MPKYDFLIVGAGFFGATCARLLTDAGYKCLIIEKEKCVGGLAATEIKDDIIIHKFGGHILHTDDDEVWNFLKSYDNILQSNNTTLVQNEKEYYQLPFNMSLLSKIYGNKNPEEIENIIKEDRKNYGVVYRRNLEEDLIYRIGFKGYMLSCKGYYEKLFNEECKNLSISYLREIRNDFTYNNSFYSNKYYGIPENGYTSLVEKIIGDDIDIILGVDFVSNKDKYLNLGSIIISSIGIDKFCNYVYGHLDWVSMKIETKDFSKQTNNFSGCPIIRINDTNNEMIEMIEHKWFTPYKNSESFNSHTYVSYLIKDIWNPDKECLFAINSDKSENLLNKYIEFASDNFNNVIFGGRQGIYRNISITETVRLAMDLVNDIMSANS